MNDSTQPQPLTPKETPEEREARLSDPEREAFVRNADKEWSERFRTGEPSPAAWQRHYLIEMLDRERAFRAARTADPGGLREDDVQEWLQRADGRLLDIFGLWVQGKRDDAWVAHKLVTEGHLAALASETTAPARTADPGGLRLAIETTRAYGVSIGWAGGPGDAVSEVLHRLEALASETAAPAPTADPGGLREWAMKNHRTLVDSNDREVNVVYLDDLLAALASETTAPAPTLTIEQLPDATDPHTGKPVMMTRPAPSIPDDALRTALLVGPDMFFPNLPSQPTLPDVLDAVAFWMDAVDEADGNPKHDVQRYLRERAVALRAALTTAPEPTQVQVSFGTSSSIEGPFVVGERVPDDALRMVEAVARGLAEPDGLTRSEAADALRAALASETTAPAPLAEYEPTLTIDRLEEDQS